MGTLLIILTILMSLSFIGHLSKIKKTEKTVERPSSKNLKDTLTSGEIDSRQRLKIEPPPVSEISSNSKPAPKAKTILIKAGQSDLGPPSKQEIKRPDPDLALPQAAVVDPNSEFYSTTALGKIIGIQAKPTLFDRLIQLGYITRVSGKLVLTTLGQTPAVGGRYRTGHDGSRWIVWPLSLAEELFPTKSDLLDMVPSKESFGRSSTAKGFKSSDTPPAKAPQVPIKPDSDQKPPAVIKPKPLPRDFNELSPPPITHAEYEEYISRAATLESPSVTKRKAIENIVEEKNISHVVHFTRAENLPSILKHGIRSVVAMNKEDITYLNNDQVRWDNRLDGISVSISSPNCKMFYKYRKNNPGTDWAVLIIRQSILWEKECAFLRHNAADSRVRILRKSELTTSTALKAMFLDNLQSKNRKLLSRNEQDLQSCEPTDEQAEVLVFETIAPEEIVGICFEDSRTKNRYVSITGTRALLVDNAETGMFSSRDYVHSHKTSGGRFDSNNTRNESDVGFTRRNGNLF